MSKSKKSTSKRKGEYFQDKQNGIVFVNFVDMYSFVLLRRYITWREQNYAQNNKETDDLMERCVLHFQQLKEFQQNELYIDIWLKLVHNHLIFISCVHFVYS